jgi:hypothetical protein
MKFRKNGVVQDEFFPQDLAGDSKGQEQASKLVRGIRLRRVLSKTGFSKEESDALLKIWLNQLPDPKTILDLHKLVHTQLDKNVSTQEREVFLELRSKFAEP